MPSFFRLIRRAATAVVRRLTALTYLPYVLSRTERRIFVVFALLTVGSGIWLGIDALHITIERQPATGGAYREGVLGSPSLVNPLFAIGNSVDRDISRLVYSGLVRVAKDQTIVPDLAEQLTVSPDKKTYTVRLRTNARWHDGEPVTADDVLFTIARIQDPEMKSPLAQSFVGVTADKLDDHAVQITLKEVFAPFLDILTVGILPKHIWNDVPAQTATLAEYNVKPIGSGPFLFSSFVKDKRGTIKEYTLAAFPQFYRPRPFLDTITFVFVGSDAELTRAFAQGTVDGFGSRRMDPAALDNGPAQVFRLPLSQYTALFFNQDRNANLKDKRVREAIARAVNRDNLIRDAVGDSAMPIAGPILFGSLGYTTEVEPYVTNLDAAKKLLEDAGWKLVPRATIEEAQKKSVETADKQRVADAAHQTPRGATPTPDLSTIDRTGPTTVAPATGMPRTPEIIERPLDAFRTKNGVVLTLTLTTVEVPENRAVVEALRTQIEGVGIPVTLDIRSENFQRDVLQSRAYEALLFGIVVGRDPDPFPFWHSSQREGKGANLALYANRSVDGLLEDGRRTDDPNIRKEKYLAFQKTLTSDLPAHFLYTPTYTVVLNRAIEGFAVTRMNSPVDRFLNIEEWYRKTDWSIVRKK